MPFQYILYEMLDIGWVNRQTLKHVKVSLSTGQGEIITPMA